MTVLYPSFSRAARLGERQPVRANRDGIIKKIDFIRKEI